ncbi:MAG: biotin-dependent carboxyltransferase family protein [Candidatus Eremiobacteraeota bacterium]|nr:biotin-dependent carboxyltransferase family protein [Candidatus Eremiobacteraeota bacterium]MBV8365618.1 biotin-dependent carboxyltransferase family protein [Candidatus Eremiobacteraeota bacterium]
MVTRSLRVLSPGVLTTVQDSGRRDVARFGVSPAGWCDWYSAAAANLLVGNGGDAAVLETMLTGARFELHGAVSMAVTGAHAALLIDGVSASRWRAHDAGAGSVVEIAPAQRGARSYLAIDGGVQVPLVMGSASTDTGAGFGGYQGRPLRSGDVLTLHEAGAKSGSAAQRESATVSTLEYPHDAIPAWGPDVILRVLPGPHASAIPEQAWQALLGQTFGVSSRSTRQGLQLEGTPLTLEGRTDVISAGAFAGCVQITNAGAPVLLLAEHQTTGGYATVACIISADVPLAGQARPGDRLRFERVTRIEAARAHVQRRAALHSLRPAGAGSGLSRGFHEGV